MRLAPRAFAAALALWLASGLAAPAEALDGGPEAAPQGQPVAFAAPPPGAASWPAVCSLRHPLCVGAPPSVGPARALAAVGAADRAWDVMTGALALPPPDGSLDGGGFRVYLVDAVPGGGDAALQSLDPRTRFDRGVTFGLVQSSLGPGCALDLAVARALARAAVLQAAPATDPGTARAEGESLARLAVACADPAPEALEFQSHPERTLVDATSDEFARGASLFFDWLDETFAREPGALVGGLLALAPTRTAPGASRFPARPTAFDVLRVSLRGAFGPDSNLDDVFARFGVARAARTPAPRFAWHIPWPASPRRLASPEPVSPTGASYVLLDRAGAAPAARLRVEAQWEDYGRMRWFAVKLDAAGKASAVVPINSLDLGTRASMTIESLEGTAGVLVVGVNVGSTEHPFDPHQGEWEPHGWLLTVEAE